MSNGTESPPVDTIQHQPEYGPGQELAAEGLKAFPMYRGEKAPVEEVVKSWDPEEGYLTRHEPTAQDLIDTEGAPYSESDRRKYDPSKSLIDAAKEFLFIADKAGEPKSATSTPGTVHLVWEDGSAITIRFEARRGELGAASGHATQWERNRRNIAYERALKVKESLAKQKQEVRGEQAQARQREDQEQPQGESQNQSDPMQQVSGSTEPQPLP